MALSDGVLIKIVWGGRNRDFVSKCIVNTQKERLILAFLILPIAFYAAHRVVRLISRNGNYSSMVNEN